MPNNEGRTATRSRKATTEQAEPAVTEKTERHVRTPLERAEANAEKAAGVLAKLKKKRDEAQAKVDELKPAIDEAEAVANYTASHPLLVAKRRAEGGDQAVAGTPAATVVEGDFADGSEIVSSVPTGDEDDEDGDDGAPAPGAAPFSAPFDFEAGLAAGGAAVVTPEGGLAAPPAGQPFNFDEPQNVQV